MTIEEVTELFGYGSWATMRMFAAAEALTPEQQTAVVASSFPSIRATLAHIVGAESFWLSQWMAASVPSTPLATLTIAELRGQLETVEAQRASFLASLTSVDLDRMVSYSGIGEAFSLPLGQLMRHVVNHSTYHRGQLATQFRQLGYAPPNTDLTRYLYETASERGAALQRRHGTRRLSPD
jgi:uncharacterized damage-inducible protein DinB